MHLAVEAYVPPTLRSVATGKVLPGQAQGHCGFRTSGLQRLISAATNEVCNLRVGSQSEIRLAT